MVHIEPFVIQIQSQSVIRFLIQLSTWKDKDNDMACKYLFLLEKLFSVPEIPPRV